MSTIDQQRSFQLLEDYYKESKTFHQEASKVLDTLASANIPNDQKVGICTLLGVVLAGRICIEQMAYNNFLTSLSCI